MIILKRIFCACEKVYEYENKAERNGSSGKPHKHKTAVNELLEKELVGKGLNMQRSYTTGNTGGSSAMTISLEEVHMKR